MLTVPASSPRRAARWLAVIAAGGLLVPAATGGSAAALASAGAGAGNPGVASPAVAGPAPGPLPGAVAAASGVTQPSVRSVPLGAVDPAVLRVAPGPDGQAHGGGVGQSGVERPTVDPDDLHAAVAATVSAGTRPAALVAVSAESAFAAGTEIRVRVRQPDGWSDWESLAAQDGHGPDPGSAEARGVRAGSEPLMTGAATQVQVRIDTPDGRVPGGTRLDVISASTNASDALLAGGGSVPAAPDASAAGRVSSSAVTGAQGTVAAAAVIPRPAIFTRAQWGADESWRSRAPYYTGAIRAGFLHHTASTSNYTPEQTPAQIRAIYAYHTKSLGHSDIDYNFVVDRFGRLWEGRYGGMDSPVLGGHTAGFNENTFAVVALGNFQTTAPPAENLARIKDSVARLFAWKLGLYGVSPVSTAHLLSAGYSKPTRYPRGTVAAIPAISSHQMVNYTSCPGSYLQRELPAIRTLAARYAHLVISPPVPTPATVQVGSATSVAFSARTDRAVTWRADIFSPCSTTPVRSYSGRTSRAGPVAVRWDLRDGAGAAQLPAAYTVRLTGTAKDGSTVFPVHGSVVITPAPGGVWGPCANVARVAGPDPAATSVLWGRIFAPHSRTVVLTAPATQSATALAASVAAGPLARHLKAPLLLTGKSGLSASVTADIRARNASEVLVVGDTSVVPSAVTRALQKLGTSVTRVAGDTAADTAAAVAARFPTSLPVVLVAPSSAPAHALAGSALAATRDNPVLLTGESTIPRATRAALTTRRSVTVAVPTTLSAGKIDGAVADGAEWVRLAGADEVAASTAIGSATSKRLPRVVVLPAVPSTWGSAALAAAVGTPLLFTNASSLPDAVGTFLDSRAGLRTGLTPVPRSALTDSVLGATSRLLAGAPWAPRVVASYKLTRLNATPEPVRKGAKVKVTARVKVSDGTGAWRKAAIGTVVTLQFRPSGVTAYRPVRIVRLSTAGKAKVTATATTSGRWRLVVGGKASKSDHVRVRS